MLKLGLKLAAAALRRLHRRSAAPAQAQDAKKTFYLLSHGGPSDAFWLDWNAGATKACEQLNVDLQDLLQRRRHGGAEGGVQLGDRRQARRHRHHLGAARPVDRGGEGGQGRRHSDRLLQHRRLATGRQAYVGADLKQAGVIWAKYLVDNKLVKQGDKVFLPVEVPGASYQQLETEGIASVFDPLGIKYDVVDAGTDPAGIIAKMTRLYARQQSAGDHRARRFGRGQRASASSTTPASSRARSRSSAGAIRRTRRRP